MKTTERGLEAFGFESVNRVDFTRVELEAKGWIVRWIGTLRDYYLEPIFQPTARIKVDTIEKLTQAFILIVDRDLEA